jgi:hypothetical protein
VNFDGALEDFCIAMAGLITAITALIAAIVALRKEWRKDTGKEGNGTHKKMDAQSELL